MSIRHPEFCTLVETLASDASRHKRPPALSDADRELLTAYAEPSEGIVIEDQLGHGTVEAVEALTGESNVWSPERAARALLAELNTR
jgi:hypothetical protein